MHPICYFRTDNVTAIGPFPAPTYLRKFIAALPLVDTASHDKIDELSKDLFGPLPRGRRDALRYRRMDLRNRIMAKAEAAQRQAFIQAKRDGFIGPLTISQNNGHPF